MDNKIGDTEVSTVVPQDTDFEGFVIGINSNQINSVKKTENRNIM